MTASAPCASLLIYTSLSLMGSVGPRWLACSWRLLCSLCLRSVFSPSLNAVCPPILLSLYPCDLSCSFIPPFSVFLWERHFSFASVYFLLSHWLAPSFPLKKCNLLNSQCKPILITLCVLFLGVDSVVRQLDFNLSVLPVNYIKSNPSSPYRTAAIKRVPAPSMSESGGALTDVSLHYPQPA